MSNSIKDQLADQLALAIGARKDSLKALRARIIDLLDDVPVGVRLSDDAGLVVKVARVCTGASQWSNRTWDVTIKGWGLIAENGRLVAEHVDGCLWDGHNNHYRTTEPTCLGTESFDPEYHAKQLTWATGCDTRAIAARLPEAIARYMAECEAERAANEAMLAS